MSTADMIMPGVQITALQPVMLAEGLLHRMQRAVRRQPLDRRHRSAVERQRQCGAGLDRLAIDMDHASAALAGVASDMGAGEPKVLAQKLHE